MWYKNNCWLLWYARFVVSLCTCRNAETIPEFWAEWNIPVHKWARRWVSTWEHYGICAIGEFFGHAMFVCQTCVQTNASNWLLKTTSCHCGILYIGLLSWSTIDNGYKDGSFTFIVLPLQFLVSVPLRMLRAWAFVGMISQVTLFSDAMYNLLLLCEVVFPDSIGICYVQNTERLRGKCCCLAVNYSWSACGSSYVLSWLLHSTLISLRRQEIWPIQYTLVTNELSVRVCSLVWSWVELNTLLDGVVFCLSWSTQEIASGV